MAYQVPASDSRKIFIAAEDFNKASRILIRNIGQDGRMVAPQITLAAFTVELFLKCILVDGGAPTIPAKHDLLLIFNSIPKDTRAKIEKVWKICRDRLKDKGTDMSDFPAKMETVITKTANYFDDWRFSFERPKGSLTMEAKLVCVIDVLHAFLLKLHPEWRIGGDQYFLSTFPAP